MNIDKSDYFKGLTYFVCLVFFIFLFTTVPDGESLFYKLLGLFGVSPGIRLGNNSTLYIYGLILIVGLVVCVKKALKYWYSYGVRFKGFHFLMRYLPVFIIASVFIVTTNVISPTVLDCMYYSVIGQRGGLRAVTYTSANEYLRYEFDEGGRRYFYELTFKNHSDEAVTFGVKLVFDFHLGKTETIRKNEDGEIMTLTLLPNQQRTITDGHTEHHPAEYVNGIGNGNFSVVLFNGEEQYSPKPITKR